MKGRVAMVTGANAGMGRQTSLELARAGATVVMVCRNRDRGQAALEDVRTLSGSDSVELLVGDLSSQKSIRALVSEFTSGHDRLHVLVNNAGVTLPKRTVTVEGLETVFATNHLGPFLLTSLLLPVLRASAPARIVTVSSGVQSMAKLNLDDLQSMKDYKEMAVYNQSKLLNLLFTYELARRLEGSGVTANAVEPGFVRTNMKVPFPFSILGFMRGSVENGAKSTVYAATSEEVENVSGKFFNQKSAPVKSSATSFDEITARRLWEISEKMTALP